MGFKKNKIRKENHKKYSKGASFITWSFGLISVFVIGFFALNTINNISFTNFSLNFLSKFANQVKSGPKKDVTGKTNILLVGIGGTDHEGPNLTDTIMLASINHKEKSITMLSIPRDLYIEFNDKTNGKINEVFMRGYYKYIRKGLTEKESFDGGMDDLMKKVTQITGEEIKYYANVDFAGFIKGVDILGGIDIKIPETLIDNKYPNKDYGYETFQIKKGLQKIDGKTALKYARSRHSTSDFSRSNRQQLILKAIRNKALSKGIFNPIKIRSLYFTVKENLKTNLKITDMISLALFIKDLNQSRILSFNLNDSCFYGAINCKTGGFLYVPVRENFGGLSVLVQDGATKNTINNYDAILKFTNFIFNFPNIYIEKSKVNIFNSTKISGLANKYAENLKKYGFTIPAKNSIGNTSGDKYKKSTILYNNIADNSQTLDSLKLFIFGGEKKIDYPLYSEDKDTKIEIIIGDDYKNLIY